MAAAAGMKQQEYDQCLRNRVEALEIGETCEIWPGEFANSSYTSMRDFLSELTGAFTNGWRQDGPLAGISQVVRRVA